MQPIHKSNDKRQTRENVMKCKHLVSRRRHARISVGRCTVCFIRRCLNRVSRISGVRFGFPCRAMSWSYQALADGDQSIGGYHVFSPFVSRCVRARALVPREPRQARARTLRGTPHGGLQVNKSGSQGLKTWYPPILRVLNPFLALV